MLTGESVWIAGGFVKRIAARSRGAAMPDPAATLPPWYEHRGVLAVPIMAPLLVRLAISRFLDPGVLVVLALGVGLFLAFRGRRAGEPRAVRAGRALAWAAWGGLWLLSMPFVANALTSWVEVRGPDLDAALAGKDRAKVALVVLAGGLQTLDESLPLRERLDAGTTHRVLTASRLYREQRFGLVDPLRRPAGGDGGDAGPGHDPGRPPASGWSWSSRSGNTRGNAAFSAAILRERRPEAVVLVTSATHLRRAVKDFEAAGVHVIPAAADIIGHGSVGIDSFLPSAGAFAQSHVCLHEILGYVRG